MLGGFKVQGKDVESARAMIADAEALEEAGAFAILLECVPTAVSKVIRERVDTLVFSIGAGPVCDGQLLIMHDVVGLFQAFQPKFCKQYCNLAEIMTRAFTDYRKDVKDGTFPAKENEFSIKKSELAKLEEALAEMK
jgi:3-methyl-2-oxobutanoate hydroxymethyltransferase